MKKYILAIILPLLLSSNQVKAETTFSLNSNQKKTVINNLSEALQYKTVTHYDLDKIEWDQFKQFTNFLEKKYPLTHKSLNRKLINKYSLLFKWTGKNENLKPILLNAHYDVVPAEKKTLDQWEQPPFSGKVSNGMVWGRGAMDDKSSLTAIMEATELLLSKKYQPERTIYLAFGHDEEIGGLEGAAKISKYLESNSIKAKFVLDEGGFIITDEFLGIKKPKAVISTAEKGFMNVKLTVKSLGGHSSRAPEKTGIDIMSEAITKIDENPMKTKFTLPLNQGLSTMSPHMPFVESFIIGNMWLFQGIVKNQFVKRPATNALIRTLITPTMIQGGTKENALPKYVTANLNIRLLPGDSVKDVIRHIKKVINDDRVEVKIHGEPVEASKITNIKSKEFQYIKSNINQTYKNTLVSPMLAIGSTDTIHYGNISDKIMRFLPIKIVQKDGERIHGINERLSIDNYYECIEFYFNIMKNIESL